MDKHTTKSGDARGDTWQKKAKEYELKKTRTKLALNICTICGADKAKACQGCGTVAYCSTDCQRIDWRDRGHRKACKSIQAERAAEAAPAAPAAGGVLRPRAAVARRRGPCAHRGGARGRTGAARGEPGAGAAVGAVRAAVPDLLGRMGRERRHSPSDLLLPKSLRFML